MEKIHIKRKYILKRVIKFIGLALHIYIRIIMTAQDVIIAAVLTATACRANAVIMSDVSTVVWMPCLAVMDAQASIVNVYNACRAVEYWNV